jgi:protein tyrosine/serine phosphatase
MIPRFSKRRIQLTALCAVMLLAVGGWYYWKFIDTYHFAVVQEGVLYRDGLDNMREFETAVRKSNAKTVVCLVDQREIGTAPFAKEVGWLRRQGIKLEYLPVTIGSSPDSAQVQEFLDVVTNKENQPVLVHCRHGVDRTAMMAAAYQESILGYTDDQAVAAILPFGREMDSRRIKVIRDFIADYDGQTRTKKSELATQQTTHAN